MGRNKMLILGLLVVLLITLVSIGGCTPAGESGGTTSIWPVLIFLVMLFGLMYLVTIRPQRRRQKEHQQLVEGLNRGDRVITAGGIYGVIESLDEDSIVIKVESGTTMRVVRGSITGKRDR